jgi:hypothetical protein
MLLAMSEKVAVPLSAATTRYGIVLVVAHGVAGGTISPRTRLSVTSSRLAMNRR